MALETDDRIEVATPKSFWIGLLIGGAVATFGVYGLLTSSGTRPDDSLRWVLGGLIAHDAILAPVVFAIAWVAARKISRPTRALFTPAILISAMVLLFAFPLVRGYGYRPDNLSLLPHDYVTNTVVLIGVIWLVTALAYVVRRIRGK